MIPSFEAAKIEIEIIVSIFERCESNFHLSLLTLRRSELWYEKWISESHETWSNRHYSKRTNDFFSSGLRSTLVELERFVVDRNSVVVSSFASLLLIPNLRLIANRLTAIRIGDAFVQSFVILFAQVVSMAKAPTRSPSSRILQFLISAEYFVMIKCNDKM